MSNVIRLCVVLPRKGRLALTKQNASSLDCAELPKNGNSASLGMTEIELESEFPLGFSLPVALDDPEHEQRARDFQQKDPKWMYGRR